ncbi:MAG: LytR/AlgR family response regulator transcription factor [Candidatus Cyclobacteriaceae bacterium M3_2C_046]
MIRTVIIEDEPLAAERLEKMIRETAPELEIVATIGSVKKALGWFARYTADLIFLDIQLSDGLSFSIFDHYQLKVPVIFTTAYDQYAIKAFQLNSVDYLLKPIRQSELRQSLDKLNSLRTAYAIDFSDLMDTIKNQQPAYKRRFLLQFGETIKKVEASEIAYFFALDKGVFMRTFSGQTFPVDSTLDKLELQMDPLRYFRINRKYMINIESINKMVAYSRGRIKLYLKPDPGHLDDPVVSIERSADFKNWLNQ